MIVQTGQTVVNGGAAQGTTVVLARPAGAAQFDVGLFFVMVRDNQGVDPGLVMSQTFGFDQYAIRQAVGNPGWKTVVYVHTLDTAINDPGPWTFVWDSNREYIGVLLTYGDNAGGKVRVCARTAGGQINAVQFDAPSYLSNVAGQMIVSWYGVAGAGVPNPGPGNWTPAVGMTEVVDQVTAVLGGNDISMMIAEELLAGTGATGVRTATLDPIDDGFGASIPPVALLGATEQIVLTVGGVYKTAVATWEIYGGTKAENGQKIVPEELRVGFPNQVRKSTVIAGRPTYSIVSGTWKLGSTLGSEATTLLVKDCELELPQTFTTEATNLGSWTWELGNKVGSADNAPVYGAPIIRLSSGKTIRGNFKIYGPTFVMRGAGNQSLTIQNQLGGLVSDVISPTFIIESTTAGTVSVTLGSATVPIGNLYDPKFFLKSVGGASAQPAIFATKQDKAEYVVDGFSRVFESALANAYALRRVDVRGAPTLATFRWGSASNLHRVSGMKFPPGAKFSVGTSGVPTLANAFILDALYERAIVRDALTGLPLAGIPFKVTEFVTNPLGNALVNVVSDANGLITFGSGQTLDAVIVADFYAAATTATMRYRGPFLFEVNVGGNPAYESRTRLGDWPSDVPVTISAGNFYDVEGEVWALGPPSAPAGPPVPVLVEDVPIAAPGEIRFEVAVPST